MKTKIITQVSSDNDKIGIVLYGCGTSNNALGFPMVNVFQKLDMPDANNIKQINDILELSVFKERLGQKMT